jgi:hypothetical protein
LTLRQRRDPDEWDAVADDRDSKPVKRAVRVGDDPRDVIGDRKPPARRTPAYGTSLSDDARDRLVPKHPTPELAAPHTVPYETTGVYTRRKIESVSTSIEQLKLDQMRQNNQQERQATQLAHVSGRVDLLDAKLDGVDGKLDIVTDLVRNHARVETETTVADMHMTKVRQTTALEDQAGRKKLSRSVVAAIVGALAAIASALATHLLGSGG